MHLIALSLGWLYTFKKTVAADLVTGNRREILTDFYERSVADLPADMRAFVEDKLTDLSAALREPSPYRSP